MNEFYLQVALQYIDEWVDYVPIQMQEIPTPAPMQELATFMGKKRGKRNPVPPIKRPIARHIASPRKLRKTGPRRTTGKPSKIHIPAHASMLTPSKQVLQNPPNHDPLPSQPAKTTMQEQQYFY